MTVHPSRLNRNRRHPLNRLFASGSQKDSNRPISRPDGQGTHTFSASFSEEEWAVIQKMAEAIGEDHDYRDVFRRALELFKIAVEAETNQKSIVLVDEQDRPVQRLTVLS